MDGAVGALRQRLADGLGGAFRTGTKHDHLAAMLFFQEQRLFERIGVRLVDFEAEVLFVDPLAAVIDADSWNPAREPALWQR